MNPTHSTASDTPNAAPVVGKSREASGHWYDREGNLIELVPGSKKGSMVEPDLRHARKLQLAPGQSTIRYVAAAFALDDWKQKQVLMSALTLPRNAGETDEAFCDRVMLDSQAAGKAAADLGTALHALVEHGLAQRDWTDPWVACLGAKLQKMTCAIDMREEWILERSVSHVYGFGTKADAYIDHPVAGQIVIDIKTKEPKPGKSVADEKLWDAHLQQLSATREALGMPHAACGIAFLDRTKPEVAIVMATEAQLQQGWKVFKGLLYTWQSQKGYAPDWALPVFQD